MELTSQHEFYAITHRQLGEIIIEIYPNFSDAINDFWAFEKAFSQSANYNESHELTLHNASASLSENLIFLSDKVKMAYLNSSEYENLVNAKLLQKLHVSQKC